MKRFAHLIALISAALLSQACARNTLSIRELASDVARARCACKKPQVRKEIRIEKTMAGAPAVQGEAAPAAVPQLKILKAVGEDEAAQPCPSGRTQATWLIFDSNGIETLYWCTPSHEMTEKPACIPVRYGGAAIFPEPGLKHLPLPKGAQAGGMAK